ncbi:protein kinase [Actinomadura sp.]|uniref:protein kinase domain-containing protein n=1 Tax=Actinomadura sp. TaxID=1989 RepID=UPI0037CB9AD4
MPPGEAESTHSFTREHARRAPRGRSAAIRLWLAKPPLAMVASAYLKTLDLARLAFGARRRRSPPPLPPPRRDADDAAILDVPLRDGFRYVHEPLSRAEPGLPDLADGSLAEALRERITFSRGGTFLISGFRGVGKTTLVQRVLEDLERDPPPGRRVLPVVLSVARPMSTEHLLFAIVRRVFEALNEAGAFETLPDTTRQALLLTYMRTSLSFKEMRSDATERTATADIGMSALAAKLAGSTGVSLPKVGLSAKRTRSLATEAAFLAYSETDVEHDMMRVVRMLSAAPPPPRGLLRGPLRGLGRSRRGPFPISLVVVLDEMDKLTAVQDGMAVVEKLLGGMKNVVTMPGAYYLMVAGPDLQDQVLLDSGRGNSVYESVFAWRLYTPCNWEAPSVLLDGLVDGPVDEAAREPLDALRRYLAFKARGVLRRLLQELHTFVVWRQGRPRLRITDADWGKVAFYAQMEDTLRAFFADTRGKVFPTEIDQDRWRLGGYYVLDWILRSDGLPFTSSDIVKAVEEGDFDALLRITPAAVDLLLEHLERTGVLAVVRRVDADSTFVVDVSDSRLTSYRLADDTMRRLRGLAVTSQTERAELEFTLSPQMLGDSTVTLRRPPPSGADRHEPPLPRPSSGPSEPRPAARPAPELRRKGLGDRYELRRLIGEGGMSSVYEGFDLVLQRVVAVKLLRTALADDGNAVRRFRREAEISKSVRHPNVVEVFDIVEQEDGFAIVMEYLQGESLSDLVAGSRTGPAGGLPPGEAVGIAITMAEVLGYLHSQGLARLDIKPGNIIMVRGQGPVLIDLGIAKSVEKNLESWDTQIGVVVGTPLYMAPEQARGAPVDGRVDIYALGVVLYVCLTGRHPFAERPAHEVMEELQHGIPLDTASLPVSAGLRRVIDRATAADPAARYENARELADDLRATDEAAEGDSSAAPPEDEARPPLDATRADDLS